MHIYRVDRTISR